MSIANVIVRREHGLHVLYDTFSQRFISIAANPRYAMPVNFVPLKHAEWNKGRRVHEGTFLNRYSTNSPTTAETFRSSLRPLSYSVPTADRRIDRESTTSSTISASSTFQRLLKARDTR